MALATRPKPKTHHKKRQAQHHRRNKHYLKAYFPYIPMLAIVGLGYIINKLWSANLVESSYLPLDSATGSVTRIEALVGTSNTWSLLIVVVLAGLAASIFVFRNWYRVHRTLNRGEAFMVHHPWFDVALVFVITAGIILTRTTI